MRLRKRPEPVVARPSCCPAPWSPGGVEWLDLEDGLPDSCVHVRRELAERRAHWDRMRAEAARRA